MIHPLKVDESTSPRLDDFIAAFEAVRVRGSAADLAEFLPERDHPLYLEVLRELVRVDLELSWEQGCPQPLKEYRRRFPELFDDQASRNAIAFEEYRLRRAAGEAPVPAEYERAYAVSVTGWPPPRSASATAEHLLAPSTDALGELDALTQQMRAGSIHAQLVQDLDGEAPQSAQRLAEGLLTLPAVGDEFLGFRLESELGRGAIGCVFLARQEGLAHRPVALKVAPALFGESQTLAQLQHTHIVPIYSVHTAGALQAVCMPFYGRTTLADVLRDLAAQPALPRSGPELLRVLHRSASEGPRSEGPATLFTGPPSQEQASASPDDPQPLGSEPSGPALAITRTLESLSYVEAVLWLGRCLAEGLAHAHERGIVHRDLKPANVLLTDEGQPMLLDFNLAEDTKLRGSAPEALVGGTLPYMAPEQLEMLRTGEGTADMRGDLFALGVILYELLTGRPPFPPRPRLEPPIPGGQPAELRRHQLEGLLTELIRDRSAPPPYARRWNAAVSPAADTIVRRCLEPDPARRYQSARELQEDLQCQLDRLPLKHTPEPSLRERTRKWLYRHPRLPLRMLMGGAVLLFALALWFGLNALNLTRSKAALTALQGFREDLRAAHMAFSSPGDDVERRSKGQELAERALARFHVLDDPSWAEQELPAALSSDDNGHLRHDAGDLLLQLARARAWPVAPSKFDETSRRADMQAALALNRRAEDCYPAGAAPKALWLQRADLHRELGQFREADACRRRVKDVTPQTAQDYYLLAREDHAAGRPHAAIEKLRKAAQLAPQDFLVWFLLGSCHFELTENVEAVNCYSTCIFLSPRAHWAYLNRGIAYYRQRDYPRALADFRQFIKLKDELPEGYLNRGLVQQARNRHADAVADFTAALKRDAPPTRLYFLRAISRRWIGDKEGARRDQEEGLRRVPNDETSWIARARARWATDPAAGLADLEQALALNPRSQSALQNKSHVLSEMLNRPEEALRVLDRLLAWYPDSVMARGGRGVVRARLGQRDAALEDARGCLKRSKEPRTCYQVACIYALTSRQHPEDRRKAIELLTASMRRGYRVGLLTTDPDLEPLRGTPEFQRLVAAVGTLYGLPQPKRPTR